MQVMSVVRYQPSGAGAGAVADRYRSSACHSNVTTDRSMRGACIG